MPRKKLKERFDWVSLHNFSSIPILRLGYFGTIAIPVIAISVGYFNEANRIMRLALSAVIVFTKFNLPDLAEALSNLMRAFLPKIRLDAGLILLYIGSASLATGRMIYSVRCPKLIKAHGVYENYLKFVSELSLVVQRIEDFRGQAAEPDGSGSGDPLKSTKQANVRRLHYADGLPEKTRRDSLLDEMQKKASTPYLDWRKQNTSRPVSRYLVMWCYIVTAICAMYLFFFMAPLRVCYATRFETKCHKIERNVKDGLYFIFGTD